MNTAVIQIGNSDNKLTQQEWADFVNDIDELVDWLPVKTHFSGGSNCKAAWQNYCWVIEFKTVHVMTYDDFKSSLSQIASEYRQDSIALTIGNTEFVAATK